MKFQNPFRRKNRDWRRGQVSDAALPPFVSTSTPTPGASWGEVPPFEMDAYAHIDALYSMALRLTQNEDAAADLLQDTLLKAYRFYHRFNPGTNMRAWLFKVMFNVFYNTCRKDRQNFRLQQEANAEPHHEQFMSSATLGAAHVESLILDQMTSREIANKVEGLPEEFRTAVMLCDVHGFSYKEIADILNCPVGTVMSRLHRGRKLLKQELYAYAIERGYADPEEGIGDMGNKLDLNTYRNRKALNVNGLHRSR